MTKEENREIIRVCGKDYDYWDIPPGIRKRDEIEKARALSQQGEDYRQEEIDRQEREKLDNITVEK